MLLFVFFTFKISFIKKKKENCPDNLNYYTTQIYSKKQADVLNESIKMGKFPDILRKAEATPFYKKENMTDKKILSSEYIIQSIKSI